MPIDPMNEPQIDPQNETDNLSNLADSGGETIPASPQTQGGTQLGGPGPDTPQEQQALKSVLAGVQGFRGAVDSDPGLEAVIIPQLEKMFLSVMQYYGLEKEGKLALDQARQSLTRTRQQRIMGPPVPPMGRGNPTPPVQR